MIDPLQVAEGERETVRILALDLPPADAKALAARTEPNGAPPPLAQMLGVEALDFDHVEVFPASDLQGVGLSGYVADGLGVAEAAIAADAEALDAETGYVVILHARAFRGEPAALRLAPELRPLAAYGLAQAKPAKVTSPRAGAGETLADAPQTPDLGPPARLPRALVLIALVGAAVLILGGAFLIGAGNR